MKILLLMVGGDMIQVMAMVSNLEELSVHSKTRVSAMPNPPLGVAMLKNHGVILTV